MTQLKAYAFYYKHVFQKITSSNTLVVLKSCKINLTKIIKVQDLSYSFRVLIQRESNKK